MLPIMQHMIKASYERNLVIVVDSMQDTEEFSSENEDTNAEELNTIPYQNEAVLNYYLHYPNALNNSKVLQRERKITSPPPQA